MSLQPELRIPFHRPSLTEAEKNAVLQVLDSGWLTTGERTLAFERAVATDMRIQQAVAVNSATAALHLALEALGVGEADEVVVPTYTFAACASVVMHLGARPRLADVDQKTLCISAEAIEAQITPSTKAIMVVHFGGLLADMEPILALARDRSIPVVEDAAHALPCSREGRQAGAASDAGALSFYATKPVTTGEGGMLITNRTDIADRARLMRLHGITRDAWRRYTTSGSWYYEIEEAGFKYNMPDIAAALGLVQWRRAEAMRKERERVAYAYREAIGRYGLSDQIELPVWPGNGEVHAWHLFPIRLRAGVERNAVIDSLRSEGIGTSVHFIPLHLHPLYAKRYGYRPDDFPIATAEYAREISLPIYPSLSEADVDAIVAALAHALSSPKL